MVAHIGTYTTLGVKSGLKDIGRVLGIDYMTMDSISKAIDEISDDPGLSFKMLDELGEGEEANPAAYAKFCELEEANKEIFRLARAFEGIPRNMGVHASGILVTPVPVIDYAPIKYVDGEPVALYEGPTLEGKNFLKQDILGLKTVTVIKNTLKYVKNISSMNDLYKKVDLNDKKVYKYIAQKNTDAVFQLESDTMKSLIGKIEVSDFNDIVATNALCRPGPLRAGYGDMYADVKHNRKEKSYPIRGCEDILDSTYGVICFQEQLMLISKRIAGFDDFQADAICRKIIAKKKANLFPMMIRCHIFGKKNIEGPEGWEENENAPWYDPKAKYGKEIPGAIANGYTAEEVKKYFDDIMGFAKYAFNKSHACSYSYISYLTAWLKYYYPTEFMAAVLTMAAQDAKKDEKMPRYLKVCEKDMKLLIKTPDINISGYDFTPNGKTIRYGLSSVKNVGEVALKDIVANQPYDSLEDAINRIPKKSFNKRIGENLIKAGAFDSFNPNRYELLNTFHTLRKDKGVEEYDITQYDEDAIMKLEIEALGVPITYKPWWEIQPEGVKIEAEGIITGLTERADKNGNLMAWPKLKINKCEIKGIMFASNYVKYAIDIQDHWKDKKNYKFKFSGKKDDKGIFKLDKIVSVKIN